MKFLTIPFTIITFCLLQYSCKKKSESGDLQVRFFDKTKSEYLNENPYNIEVSSDLYMTLAVRGKSNSGIQSVTVLSKVNGISVKQDNMSGNSDNEFEVSLKLELDYSVNAGSVRTYEFVFKDNNGQTASVVANFNFLSNNFYSFRFLDFKDKDTLNAGDTLHLSPAYVSLTPNSKVKSMRIFRKIGFSDEDTVKTVPGSDFFFYQIGLITQYDYPIPASIPSGTGILHRFEMINMQNAKFVITHRTLVK